MSKMKKCIPIVMFLLFMATGISKAEPTPTISYLMNTPVSMLDFGIYRLENFLIGDVSNLAIPLGSEIKPDIQVAYLYNSNRIQIIFSYGLLLERNIKQIEKIDLKTEIAKLIKQIKFMYFFLDFETGKPRQGCCSSIDRFFSHQGYGLKGEPKNLNKELDEITEIYVGFFYGEKMLSAKSPLIGNKIYWGKTESKPQQER